MKMRLLYIILTAAVLLPFGVLNGQQDLDEEQLDELRDMDLPEMLNSEVSVATHVPVSMREAPSIVTLITREEIINTGATELSDVLDLLVPGFHFSQSQYGPLGVSVRGLSAFEGKALLLIDGIECNDEAFSGVIFGNHYLVENIDRIEIIRGPGSLMYGGHAALGVINVVTRNKTDFRGVYAGVKYSQMYSTYAHRNISFGALQNILGMDVSLTGYAGEGRIGAYKFSSYPGGPERYPAGKLDPFSLNLGLGFGGLEFRTIFERYNTQYSIPIEFEALHSQIKYDLKMTGDLSFSFKFTYKTQRPWNLKNSGVINDKGTFKDTVFSNNKTINRNMAELTSVWKIAPNWMLNTGAQYYDIRARIDNYSSGYMELPFGNGSSNASTHSFSVYGELMYLSDYVNLIAGGRMETSTDFKPFFVPRLAVTKIFDPFHVKLMYCRAYRVPTGAFFALSLKPEQSTNYEGELGYQISKSNFISLNIYNVTFTDVIAYAHDSSEAPIYKNRDKSGTKGFEIEYRITKSKFNLGANAAYYSALKNSSAGQVVSQNSSSFLGHPNVKLNVYAGIKFNKSVSVYPSVTIYGDRYGSVPAHTAGGPGGRDIFQTENKRFNSTLVCNLNIRTEDLLIQGLQCDLGLRNLFNSDFEYLQAISTFEPPLPANSTALVLRMLYEINF